MIFVDWFENELDVNCVYISGGIVWKTEGKENGNTKLLADLLIVLENIHSFFYLPAYNKVKGIN